MRKPSYQHPARPQARDVRAGLRRQRALGRGRQGARRAALQALGRLRRQAAGRSASPATTRRARRSPISAARWSRSAPTGYAGCKFKVGGRTPKEDAERVRAARDGGRRRFHPHRRRQPGLDAAPGRRVLAPRRRTSTSAGSRSRCTGRTTASTWPRRATMTGIPVCAGQSEISRAGCRDLMMCGRDRRLQFRRELGRRADRMAPRRRAGRRPSPSRWAITRSRRSPRICSPRSRTAPTWKRFIRTATRCSTRWSPTAPSSTTAITPCRSGPGFGIEMDKAVIDEIPRLAGYAARPNASRRRASRQTRLFAEAIADPGLGADELRAGWDRARSCRAAGR